MGPWGALQALRIRLGCPCYLHTPGSLLQGGASKKPEESSDGQEAPVRHSEGGKGSMMYKSGRMPYSPPPKGGSDLLTVILTPVLTCGSFLPHHQAINSIRTLSTWRQHPTPQVEVQSHWTVPSPTSTSDAKQSSLPLVLRTDWLWNGGPRHPLLRFDQSCYSNSQNSETCCLLDNQLTVEGGKSRRARRER